MVLTKKSPSAYGSGALTTRLMVGRNYLFPTKERDFRNFLNLMLLKQRPIYEPIIYLLRHLKNVY